MLLNDSSCWIANTPCQVCMLREAGGGERLVAVTAEDEGSGVKGRADVHSISLKV